MLASQRVLITKFDHDRWRAESGTSRTSHQLRCWRRPSHISGLPESSGGKTDSPATGIWRVAGLSSVWVRMGNQRFNAKLSRARTTSAGLQHSVHKSKDVWMKLRRATPPLEGQAAVWFIRLGRKPTSAQATLSV